MPATLPRGARLAHSDKELHALVASGFTTAGGIGFDRHGIPRAIMVPRT